MDFILNMRTSATNYEAVKHIIKNNYQNDKQHHLINKKIQKDLRHVSCICVSSLYEAVIALLSVVYRKYCTHVKKNLFLWM
jgi:hypothetical protein